MKLIGLSILMVILSSVNNNREPKIGDSINSYTLQSNNKVVLINSGTIKRTKTLHLNGVEYLIVSDKEDTISYIYTDSDKFITLEGINIKSTISQCLEESDNIIRVEPGVHFYIPLKSGWNVVIGHINNDIEKIIESGTILSFYKVSENLTNNISLDKWLDYIDK